MRTALVTGSAGFVGRHLVPKLEAVGYAVVGVDPVYPNTYLYWPGKGKSYDPGLYGRTIEDWLGAGGNQGVYDLVVHLAAHIPDISERMKGGLEQYQDIALDWAVANYVKEHPPREAFIAMTSCATDAAQFDPYAFSKTVLERFCAELHRSGVPVVLLKPYSGYGPGQALSYPMPALISRALAKQDPLIVWGSTETARDWIYIEDLCDAIIWSIKGAPHGVAVPIGTGRATTFGELASIVAHAVGYDPKIVADKEKPTSSLWRVADPSTASLHGFVTKTTLENGVLKVLEHAK